MILGLKMCLLDFQLNGLYSPAKPNEYKQNPVFLQWAKMQYPADPLSKAHGRITSWTCIKKYFVTKGYKNVMAAYLVKVAGMYLNNLYIK